MGRESIRHERCPFRYGAFGHLDCFCLVVVLKREGGARLGICSRLDALGGRDRGGLGQPLFR